MGYEYKMYYISLETMIKYTKVKTLRISEIQSNTFSKMESYNINVAQFIRDSIREKLERDYKDLIPKPEKEYCPFSNGTIII